MAAGALLPCRGIIKAEWMPAVQQSAPETLSGASDVLELGRSYWEVDIEADFRSRSDFDEWSVFLAERDGADFTFTMPRFFRQKPGDPLIVSDAGLAVPSINVGTRQISITGAGTGTAKVGDMVSYRTADNGYYIGIVRADATPAAGTIILDVWPEPQYPHATTTTPRRIEALGEFRIDGSVKWTERSRRRGVSFTARQVIR